MEMVSPLPGWVRPKSKVKESSYVCFRNRPAASISRHSLIFAHAKTFLELNVLGTSPGSYQIRYALT